MTDLQAAAYGFCPICGAPGTQRERRPNGNDICENGHEYKSSDAVPLTDLRAAAERVISVHEPRLALQHPTSELDPLIVALAKAYLAEHPADDEPLTRSWLESVAGYAEEHQQKVTFFRDDAMPIGLWEVADGWKVMLIHHSAAQSEIVRGLKTRGDFYRLCSALGIALKEPSEVRG